MINKYEATGIFASVALMALALFLMNMETATQALETDTDATASVVLSEDNPYQTLFNSVDATGEVSKLVIDDVAIGAGDSVEEGDEVAVHYIGNLTDGTAFDNSYLKDRPFTFIVGNGEVIKGWDEGVLGMKVGGQRILVIPSDLAYGERQVGPIPANATLVFAIELLAINK